MDEVFLSSTSSSLTDGRGEQSGDSEGKGIYNVPQKTLYWLLGYHLHNVTQGLLRMKHEQFALKH